MLTAAAAVVAAEGAVVGRDGGWEAVSGRAEVAAPPRVGAESATRPGAGGGCTTAGSCGVTVGGGLEGVGPGAVVAAGGDGGAVGAGIPLAAGATAGGGEGVAAGGGTAAAGAAGGEAPEGMGTGAAGAAGAAGRLRARSALDERGAHEMEMRRLAGEGGRPARPALWARPIGVPVAEVVAAGRAGTGRSVGTGARLSGTW